MSAKAFKTIRSYTQHLLTRVEYIDCWGRRIGLDYPTILAMIRKRFPEGHTTMNSLRYDLYRLDPTTRLPVRRRSRRLMAREYARSLLLERDESGRGLAFKEISRLIRRKYPDVPRILTYHLAPMVPALLRKFKSRVPSDRS